MHIAYYHYWRLLSLSKKKDYTDSWGSTTSSSTPIDVCVYVKAMRTAYTASYCAIIFALSSITACNSVVKGVNGPQQQHTMQLHCRACMLVVHNTACYSSVVKGVNGPQQQHTVQSTVEHAC